MPLKSLIYLLFVLSLSCNNSYISERKLNNQVNSLVSNRNVLVSEVSFERYKTEIVFNGKLSASRKSSIPFIIQENIISVDVNIGQLIKKGQLIARLNCFQYKKRLDDAKNQFENSRIDLEDQLLGLGYKLSDTASMSSTSLKIAKIRSGFNQALNNFKEAQYNYDNTFIRAPFDGIISDLEAEAYNHSSTYKKCCRLINDAIMRVEFCALESEISQINLGQKVTITPFALPQSNFIGKVTSINPSIDENGMIVITAEVKNTNGKLIDGMNTKVIIKKEVKDCIVIPKSAVLYRQKRKVVFVHEDGLAKWVYVETGEENSTHVTIIDGSLKVGQEVIISNNLNLAHETPITVINEQLSVNN